MRTTLTIDDDVLAAIKERARHEGRTAGEVLSDLARSALTQAQADAPARRNGFPVLTGRPTGVSNSLVDDLRDEEGA